MVVLLPPPVHRGLRGLDGGERPGVVEEVGLQGLVPPLDLADGGRRIGPGAAVAEPDAQRGELALQGDPAAAPVEPGEYRAIEFLSGVKQFGGVRS
jgi:hypothetical protein